MEFGKKVSGVFYAVAVIYLVYCIFFTPNFLISIPIVIYPIVAYRLFWIDSQPNILFFGMMLQWVPASTQLLYCNFYGITLAEKMQNQPLFSDTMELATWLSILGTFAFSFGLYVAIKPLKYFKIPSSVNEYHPRRILITYAAFSVVIFLTANLIWIVPGLVQFFFMFSYIKWGFFLITFYIIHKKGQFLRFQFYGFLILELILGLSSFFAGGLVTLVLFVGIAVIHVQPKLNLRIGVSIAIGTAFLIHYLILWSTVKTEYREFVSKGQATQVVQVSAEDARDKLYTLLTSVDSKKYEQGIEYFVNRLGYIQFFAACLNYVPEKVPYQDGDVYLSSIQHFLIPRFLNPDKKILDDSKHTSMYTGIHLSTLDEGSSFSLGYMADAYVDFGPVFMHALLFVVGWVFGLCYRNIVKNTPNIVWAWILTGPFLLLLNINGADTKKALGSLFLYFLTVFLIRKQLIRVIESFLKPPSLL